MMSDWPKMCDALDFPAEAAQMEGVMDAIRAIRNLRAEMNVAVGRRARLIIRPAEGWQETFEHAQIYFTRLAFASAVELIGAGTDNPEKSASAVCASCELYIPLGDLVDVDKELKRLNKDRENVEKEIARAEGKLSNQGFLSKAPQQLVDAEKAKLETNKAMLLSLDARIEELKTL